MKNFENLFAAWIVVWAVFFVYEVSIARRLSQLREEFDRLRQQLHER
jgi:CcmD family protein